MQLNMMARNLTCPLPGISGQRGMVIPEHLFENRQSMSACDIFSSGKKIVLEIILCQQEQIRDYNKNNYYVICIF